MVQKKDYGEGKCKKIFGQDSGPSTLLCGESVRQVLQNSFGKYLKRKKNSRSNFKKQQQQIWQEKGEAYSSTAFIMRRHKHTSVHHKRWFQSFTKEHIQNITILSATHHPEKMQSSFTPEQTLSPLGKA